MQRTHAKHAWMGKNVRAGVTLGSEAETLICLSFKLLDYFMGLGFRKTAFIPQFEKWK